MESEKHELNRYCTFPGYLTYLSKHSSEEPNFNQRCKTRAFNYYDNLPMNVRLAPYSQVKTIHFLKEAL